MKKGTDVLSNLADIIAGHLITLIYSICCQCDNNNVMTTM